MLAGSQAGGDSRCGDQTALFAHIAVTQEDGSLLTYTTTVAEGDGRNPVELLAADVNNPALASGAVSDEGDDSAVVTVGLIALGVVLLVAAALAVVIILVVLQDRFHVVRAQPFFTSQLNEVDQE